MLAKILSYKYEITAFVAGMSVMILEIVGARRIAPYFGSSVYVWTAMIGVILGALALGYWYGGRLADRKDNPDSMIVIFIIAAVLVLSGIFVESTVLSFLAAVSFDLRISSFFAALLLFAPPALFIGMISPHLAKVRLTSLEATGRTIGRLEAAGTIGSILGTFLCGYVLLSFFGSRTIVLSLVLVLITTSFLLGAQKFRSQRIVISIVTLAMLLLPTSVFESNQAVVADIDTSYARYQILKGDTDNGPARYLVTGGGGIQSAAYIDDPLTPVFDYTQRLRTVALGSSVNDTILIVGGGAHTLPMSLSYDLPKSSITIAEIDPGLDAIAREYFGYRPPANLEVVYEDGRDFLRTTTDQYDVIILDAYTSLTPPFHLATQEFAYEMKQKLEPGGVVAANVIGSESGRNREYLVKFMSTYAAVFQHIALYPVNSTTEKDQKQNYILIGSDDQSQLSKVQNEFSTTELFKGERSTVFTDDFAPIEYLSF